MGKVFVIAEAGVNHNGDIKIAKQLIDVASEAGADAVKFQTFKAERLVCKNAQKAEYQLETTDKSESQLEMLKQLELTEQMHKELMEYCEEKKIMFLSTPFDIESIKVLSGLGMQIFKIPSGEITNLPCLLEIARQQKRVILSTGMSSMDEVKAAVGILKNNGAKDITLLHCNTQYPTPVSDVNLLAMVSMREELGLPVGYSDHTQGTEIPIAAAALGAAVIEKHFTLDRNMKGPDHKASLEPHELKQMIEGIRKIESALGNGIKEASESEKANMNIVRKSIVAAANIKKGERFTEINLTTKRPGNGVSPMRWDEVIGMRANRDYDADEMVQI
ncbi:MAG: N-acetylneuraminate synthase [Roseburia sp.]|nr:N-acetylneuraminate synthase [Roseburia sp.]MCM1201661.1 N-acetylneuraminate synthase [Bacteroides fragilis]